MASKMYILVRESVRDRDEGHAVLSVAHAVAAAFRTWAGPGESPFNDWAAGSFRKVVCLVSDEQFEKAKTYFDFNKGEWLVMTESALDNEEISLVFYPRAQWPKFFQYLPLWKARKQPEVDLL